jgi:hypothetical protein
MYLKTLGILADLPADTLIVYAIYNLILNNND